VNGVDLCRILKGDPATAGTPVLLATAHAMRGDQVALMRDSGADDYVAKPIIDHVSFVAQVSSRMRSAA
jgi:CheY-like chemotaxis protein